MANYYETLGVSKTATQDEIKSAYRKLVKQYHPDLHPNDENCAAKFKEINEANETLSDPDKRKQYDFQLEHPGMGGAGGFDFGGAGGFGDIFGDIFSHFTGGGMREETDKRGEDITLEVELSFYEAAKGCKKEVSYNRKEPCSSCRGTGAKGGTEYSTCPTCKGQGQVRYVQGGGFFQSISVRPCNACRGSGKQIKTKCPDCQGLGYNKKKTTLSFDIPAGADTNSYIRKRGFGEASSLGGEAGDLIVVFKVAPHKIFSRKNFDIYLELPITFKQAALGGKVYVPGLDDLIEFNLPEGTPSGKTFVIRGKGISGRQRTGDLYFTTVIDIPTRLSKESKEFIEKFDSGLTLKNLDKTKKFDDTVDALFGKSFTDKK